MSITIVRYLSCNVSLIFIFNRKCLHKFRHFLRICFKDINHFLIHKVYYTLYLEIQIVPTT